MPLALVPGNAFSIFQLQLLTPGSHNAALEGSTDNPSRWAPTIHVQDLDSVSSCQLGLTIERIGTGKWAEGREGIWGWGTITIGKVLSVSLFQIFKSDLVG